MAVGQTPNNQNNPTGANSGGLNPAQLQQIINQLNQINISENKRFNLMKQLNRIQREIGKDTSKYYEYVKKAKELQEEINTLNEEETKTLAKINSLSNSNIANKDELIRKELTYLRLIKSEQAELKSEKDTIVSVLKSTNKLHLTAANALKNITSIAKVAKNAYMSFGADMFKMLKAIKVSGMEMGVLTKQSNSLSNDIQGASLNTIDFGIGIEELASLQSKYSDELGRTVLMSQKALENISAMGVATGLGVDGASQLASSMELVGYSAERTAEYVEQAINDSHAIGVNSSKVTKNIASNIKLLNKFNFKKGAKGLAEAAAATTKMGLDLSFASSMADKLFDVEGAVEMSAQLQVLGGEWSKLADPFKLMYMARNDMQGLQESIIEATKSTAKFNKETGEFDISSLELSRLRKVAQATGLEFDNLVTSAKNAAKFAKISGQLKFKVDKDTKEFIESTSKLNEKGEASIRLEGVDVLIKSLNDDQKRKIDEIVRERKDLKERAKDSITFDEQLSNLIVLLKQAALPLIKGLNDGLKPVVDAFVKNFKKDELIKTIQDWGVKIGEFLKGGVKLVDGFGPLIKTLGVILGGSLLFEAAKWYANGLSLGLGFNSVVGPSMGGFGSIFGSMAGKVLKGGLLVAAGMIGDTITDSITDKGSTGNMVGKSLSYAAQGAGVGSLFGPVGTAIGAGLGALYGAYKSYSEGKEDKENKIRNAGPTYTANDAIISFNKRDKLAKVDKNTFIAGTNENGNKDLAKALKSGSNNTNQISGLSEKTYKENKIEKNTLIEKQIKQENGEINVKFDDIKINGTIELKMGNGVSVDISKDLLSNPNFIRDISRMIHVETASAISGIRKQAPN